MTDMHIATIDPRELAGRLASGQAVDLIDVRTPVEYREVHAAAARNVPLDSLDPGAIAASHEARGGTLYVMCRTGSRGRQACERLLAAGLTQVVNVEGGTVAWTDAGLPVVRGEKAMSLERQVRIAAGSLVVVGVVLGWQVHPGFFGLAAFVGAGLVFAGVTDTCGMGMMLARMPWNRVSGAAGDAACRAGTSAKSTSN